MDTAIVVRFMWVSLICCLLYSRTQSVQKSAVTCAFLRAKDSRQGGMPFVIRNPQTLIYNARARVALRSCTPECVYFRIHRPGFIVVRVALSPKYICMYIKSECFRMYTRRLGALLCRRPSS